MEDTVFILGHFKLRCLSYQNGNVIRQLETAALSAGSGLKMLMGVVMIFPVWERKLTGGLW